MIALSVLFAVVQARMPHFLLNATTATSSLGTVLALMLFGLAHNTPTALVASLLTGAAWHRSASAASGTSARPDRWSGLALGGDTLSSVCERIRGLFIEPESILCLLIIEGLLQ